MQIWLSTFLIFPAASWSHKIALLRMQFLVFPIKWMSPNVLTLNPSKTEFLIIGLPQQLSQLSSPTIRLPNIVILLFVDSARNLVIVLLCSTFLICLLIMLPQSSGFPTHTKVDWSHYCFNNCYFSHSLQSRLLQLSSTQSFNYSK